MMIEIKYEIKADVLEIPPGCQPITGTCDINLVEISDPSRSCFDPQPTTTTTATTKKKDSRKHKAHS
ncbi:unnamed protein product [Rotaria sp. Silwood2]|nr:unnamed protein product [Rotaria sp. Silwood2]CAF3915479.1 unnamed protein product [Rotaria sp. Silwood2]CAF4006501.1 unnamed protein product [Rotaria sp. Silwood2]CAF4125275.1 unnamed protein product [Rotaria sp. Silwood2]